MHILLVDDHSLFAEAMQGVLSRLSDGVELQTVPSAEDALDALKQRAAFDLVLLDLGLPGLKGRAAFKALYERAGSTPIVILTAEGPDALAVELVRSGARGYVHKGATATELLSVLRFVLAGGTHIPSEALSAPAPPSERVALTPRQREVLKLLARGESNKSIASALDISEATVRVHVSSIMRALNVENRTQAATSSFGRKLAGSD